MNPAQRFVAWLRTKLGDRWPMAVKTTNGAIEAFLLAFVMSLAAHGIFDGEFGTGTTWKAAALAGWLAAGSVLKSGVMILITGQPSLGGLVSHQLRAQRETKPVRHKLPLRPPTQPRAARRRKPPATAYHGDHQA